MRLYIIKSLALFLRDENMDDEQVVSASEEQIVSALAENVNRDSFDDAFDLLIRTYEGMLMRKLLSILHNQEDAQDALQDALISAYQSLKGFPSERIREMKLKQWLYTIAINKAWRCLRETRKKPPSVPIQHEEIDVEFFNKLEVPVHERPETALEAVEINNSVLKAIYALPKIYQQTALLYFFDGYNQSQIVAELGQPPGTVRSHIHRIKAFLRKALADGEG